MHTNHPRLIPFKGRRIMSRRAHPTQHLVLARLKWPSYPRLHHLHQHLLRETPHSQAIQVRIPSFSNILQRRTFLLDPLICSRHKTSQAMLYTLRGHRVEGNKEVFEDVVVVWEVFFEDGYQCLWLNIEE